MAETIVGANGIIVPPDGYWQQVREVCDRHEVLMMCDEVMVGFGRIELFEFKDLCDDGLVESP